MSALLKRLAIRDFILIEELDIDFMSGFHVFTGETGAGKSIIIGALMQLLGAKSSKDLVRSSCEKASLQAYFDLEKSTLAGLYGLDDEGAGELIITKEISSGGKSLSKVNGLMLSARELKEIASQLVMAVGQDDKLRIYDTKEQLKILDTFLSEEAKSLKTEVSSLYSKYRDMEAELEELSSLDERALAREKDLLEYQMNEIDEANIREADEDVEADYKKMKNAEFILSKLGEASYILDNSEDMSLTSSLSSLIRTLEGLESYEPKLKASLAQLRDVNYIVRDVYSDLESVSSSYQFEEGDFIELEKRLDLINGLKKKYGNTMGDILAYRDDLNERIASLEELAVKRDKLELELQRTAALYRVEAGKLSAHRKKTAEQLSLAVSKSLKDLSFTSPEFRVAFHPRKDLAEDGLDEVDFMVRLNSGLDFSELKKVASGGEASRIMLALQEVLAGIYAPPLLIFDEIDAGLSGHAAQALAEKIYKVSKNHQVLLVSHSLQVALYADYQYLISKEDDGKRTLTNVKLLNEEERVGELCRLIGTSSESEGLMAEAKKMIDSVKKIKKKIQ